LLNTRYLVRKMTEPDLDEVMKIEQEAFSLPWSRDSYLGELKNSFANYLVCDDAGDITAYGGIWAVFEEAHITNVAVAREFRGQGMGCAVMEELENIARGKHATRILLEVRPTNEAALKIYQKLEYVQTSLRKGYYTDNGEDAMIMTKYLF
jgi:ribosomal-protein-alanine N-acetyltransferase